MYVSLLLKLCFQNKQRATFPVKTHFVPGKTDKLRCRGWMEGPQQVFTGTQRKLNAKPQAD